MRKTDVTKKSRIGHYARVSARCMAKVKNNRRRLLVESLEVRTLMAADLLLDDSLYGACLATDDVVAVTGSAQPVVNEISDSEIFSVKEFDDKLSAIQVSKVVARSLATQIKSKIDFDLDAASSSKIKIPADPSGEVLGPADEVAVDSSTKDGTGLSGENGSKEGDETSDAVDIVVPAELVGQYVFYNDSVFSQLDVFSAIDMTRHPVVESAEPQRFSPNNLLNTETGITGLVFDVSNLATTNLTGNDFIFQVSPQGNFASSENRPDSWPLAPEPQVVDVVDSLDSTTSRVVLRWADNAIENRYLRVTLLANENTGLTAPVVVYVGHLQGNTIESDRPEMSRPNGPAFEVNVDDAKAVRSHVGEFVGADSVFDINKDGIVSFADIKQVSQAIGNQLTIISIFSPVEPVALVGVVAPVGDSLPNENEVLDAESLTVPTDVSTDELLSSETPEPFGYPEIVGAFAYDARIDTGALYIGGTDVIPSAPLVQETDVSQTLSVGNLINSNIGITGLVFDIENLQSPALDASNFVFQVSPTGAFSEYLDVPATWKNAIAPSSIDVAINEDTNVSRVSIEWPARSIENRWLRITILANDSTGLQEPHVFYVGHLLGKNSAELGEFSRWNPSGVFEIGVSDLEGIRQAVGTLVEGPSSMDVNRDGVVSYADIAEARSVLGLRLSNITIGSGPASLVSVSPELNEESSSQASDTEVDAFQEIAVDDVGTVPAPAVDVLEATEPIAPTIDATVTPVEIAVDAVPETVDVLSSDPTDFSGVLALPEIVTSQPAEIEVDAIQEVSIDAVESTPIDVTLVVFENAGSDDTILIDNSESDSNSVDEFFAELAHAAPFDALLELQFEQAL